MLHATGTAFRSRILSHRVDLDVADAAAVVGPTVDDTASAAAVVGC